ncbi:hypothetical protein FKM82_023641 [Ascaphus truei]
MIWEGDLDSLDTFIKALTSNMLNLNFTYEHINHINYRDITVFIDIAGDIFRKPNSRTTFLIAESNQPRSLIHSIPKGQFLRPRRLALRNLLNRPKYWLIRFLQRGCRIGDIEEAYVNAK